MISDLDDLDWGLILRLLKDNRPARTYFRLMKDDFRRTAMRADSKHMRSQLISDINWAVFSPKRALWGRCPKRLDDNHDHSFFYRQSP